MSASYLSWPGASAENSVERANIFRPGLVAGRALHGYAIIQRAQHLSGGRVRLATGTLYTALDRLTAEGLVELVSEAIVNGRARRSYGLTPSGSGALRAEATRMADAARLVTNRSHRLKAGRPTGEASPA